MLSNVSINASASLMLVRVRLTLRSVSACCAGTFEGNTDPRCEMCLSPRPVPSKALHVAVDEEEDEDEDGEDDEQDLAAALAHAVLAGLFGIPPADGA